MAVMPPKWAQDCQCGQWVLFLDELTTCPPAVQAALLGVIAENRVGDAVLPDTVWKLAACNPPDCAANGSELEPPLANRLCHLTWETDAEAWQRGMGNALGFPQPSFVPLPPDWEKCIGRNTGPGRRVPQAQAGAVGSLSERPGQGIRAVALDAILDQCGNLHRRAGSDRRRAALALSGRCRLRGRGGGAGVPDVGASARPARPGGVAVKAAIIEAMPVRAWPLRWTFRRVAIKSWRRWPRWWTG